ncbi:MAG: hypothetical protein IJS90_09215, partial [Clostridia bacterium]|nr:hypothetical protein [Clostridia bacterium]
MQAQNTHSYTSLHINTLKTSREKFASELISQGFDPILPDRPREAVLLENCPHPGKVYGFDEGLFYV